MSAPAPQHAQHLGGRLAAAHHDRVALVVAAPAGERAATSRNTARDRLTLDDRRDPEHHDDEPRVLVAAEDERHDRRRGRARRAWRPWRCRTTPTRCEPSRLRPVEVEGLVGDAPHDAGSAPAAARSRENGGMSPRPNTWKRDRRRRRSSTPAISARSVGERQVLEEPRVGLQHARLAANSLQRASMYSRTRSREDAADRSAPRAPAARVGRSGRRRASNVRIAADQRVHRLLGEEDRGGRRRRRRRARSSSPARRRARARSWAGRPPPPPGARCRSPPPTGRARRGSARRARPPRRPAASRGTSRRARPARAGAPPRARCRRRRSRRPSRVAAATARSTRL